MEESPLSVLREWESRVHDKLGSASPASENDQLIGPFFLQLHIFKVFFLACCPLNTIPQKHLNKGEKQGFCVLFCFFQGWLLAKGPKETRLYFPSAFALRGPVTLDKYLYLTLNHLQVHSGVAHDSPGPSVLMAKGYETF